MTHFAITLLITLALMALMISGMATLLMAYFISQRYKIKIAPHAKWQRGTNLIGLALHRVGKKGISIHLLIFSIGVKYAINTL